MTLQLPTKRVGNINDDDDPSVSAHDPMVRTKGKLEIWYATKEVSSVTADPTLLAILK